ncbi:MAG TPA: VWA domain-containing protein [Candidatus Acidoferrum sp.]|nr:VWA domain-containing protein [Candidatus Acidoferrum sp.]
MGARRIAAVLVLVLVPLLLAWQQQEPSPPPPQQQQVQQQPPKAPTLHTTTSLVHVSVIVEDKNGHPAVDLTKDDFVIKDRGKVQEIGLFSVDAANAAPQPHEVLPQNTYSDEPKYRGDAPHGVTIVLLDNLNTISGSTPLPYEDTPFWLEDHALASAKQRLIEFLKKLDSNDRIAIYGLTDKVHVLCDFTCDREQLLAVVSKYDTASRTQREAVEPGSVHTPQGADFDAHVDADMLALAAMNNQARAQTTMAALTAIAAHVGDIPGRKNLLWLTSNLPFSGEAIARILARANIAAYPIDARGLLPRAPQGTIDGIMDADDYATGKLGRPPAASDQPIGIEAMDEMADDTGGHAFVDTNDLTGAIRKVIEESAVTYTLGFYVPASSLDGKFHELKVQVKQPGLDVRYPKGYFASKDAPATENERHNNFLAAIRSPLDSSVIALIVKIDRVEKPAAHSLQITGSIGLKNLQVTQKGDMRTGAVEMYIIEQDAAGNVLHQTSNRLRLNLTEQQYQKYLQSGIVFREYAQPNQNAAVLRVLVQDPATSEVGSVIIPLAQVK